MVTDLSEQLNSKLRTHVVVLIPILHSGHLIVSRTKERPLLYQIWLYIKLTLRAITSGDSKLGFHNLTHSVISVGFHPHIFYYIQIILHGVLILKRIVDSHRIKKQL